MAQNGIDSLSFSVYSVLYEPIARWHGESFQYNPHGAAALLAQD
jgi:hypothetical protein